MSIDLDPVTTTTETCPVVDGYIQTHGEDYQSNLGRTTATSDPATSDADLRSRSVVAVLDDPAAEATPDLQAACRTIRPT